MEMAGSRLLLHSFTYKAPVLLSSCPDSSRTNKEEQGWVHTVYYAVESCTSGLPVILTEKGNKRHREFLNPFLQLKCKIQSSYKQ